MAPSGSIESRLAGWAKQGVRRSMMDTASADSIVTDSAAGGSAWGCGERVDNGAVCFNRHGEIEPILVTAKRAGKATGVVSTARVTHATPASFFATVPNRGAEKLIAEQMLERGVDLALGGGAKHVTQDLLAAHPDVAVVRTADEMRAAARTDGRLVGLFNDDRPEIEFFSACVAVPKANFAAKDPNPNTSIKRRKVTRFWLYSKSGSTIPIHIYIYI